MKKREINLILYCTVGAITFATHISAGISLLLGISLATLVANPFVDFAKKWAHRLLGVAIIGLGASMNLLVVARVGLQGFGYTLVSIGSGLLIGIMIGKILRTSRDTSTLISVGTAICGGSAIAAVATAIKAEHRDTAVALAIVFILNAAALIIFPPLGHWMGMTQHQFGLWSALAVHDTSSVVGTSMQYGKAALETATTVKLARALWIVPLTLLFGRLYGSTEVKRPKVPWFILGFLIASGAVTYVPFLMSAGTIMSDVAKRLLVLTLFLIGSTMNLDSLKSVGIKPFIQGIILWAVVSTGSLLLLS